MRRLVIVVLVLVSGCGTTQMASWSDRPARVRTAPAEKSRVALGPSPCADSLYVALKARPIDSLSDREYRYMMERDRACMEYQRTASATPAVIHQGVGTGVTILAVLGALAVIGLLMPR